MESSALDPRHLTHIAEASGIALASVRATATLLAEGATVPFIARYRKEATGNLDEVEIMTIRDRLADLVALDSRRSAMLKSLEVRSLLTDALRTAIEEAETLSVLEDIYLPYRPKRRTRATIAREKGLEPLAELLWTQDPATDPALEAAAYAGKPYEVEGKSAEIADAAEALAGARDILAERISDDAVARGTLRDVIWKEGIVSSRVLSTLKDSAEAAKFRDYFDWKEPVSKIPSHRMLALRRGEKEGVLLLRIDIEETLAHQILEERFILNGSAAADEVRKAAYDAWKRLLSPSLETDLRFESKKQADVEAIRVFAANLRELLLASPLGRKQVLAIDPGFRTGCKLVILDPQGKLLHNDVIYPGQGAHRDDAARHTLRTLVAEYGIEAIAIGNGTASRETEAFVRSLGFPNSLHIVMVNESGASIYSASDVAREEFPDQDITVRGAVSIGRRLMDPLAELVKIDPKSIGVGQYQHDVDQDLLRQGLDDTVISCVNAVGVEVNTASKQLLTYVSGLGPSLAENIVRYRDANGPYPSRDSLKSVPRLGAKAFEQAAGFLRIRESNHPLDRSAVHPERYALVEEIARDLGCGVSEMVGNPALVEKIDLQRYVRDDVGLPTLKDICAELIKPGRDPRAEFKAFAFDESVHQVEDLKTGQRLPGIVTNVTAFGAFVDIGVHQDGLVHISQLADKFVDDAAKVVRPGQHVMVTVLEVDLERRRIGLSMRSTPQIGSSAVQAVKMGRQSFGSNRESSKRSGRSQREPGTPRTPTKLHDDWFNAALKKKPGRS